MNKQKAGVIRKSAGHTKTCWGLTIVKDGKTIVTKVFIDILNPPVKALKQVLTFQRLYSDPKFKLVGETNQEISIAEAFQWCQTHEGQTTGLGENQLSPIPWQNVQKRLKT